jgi:hypothetical protein
MATQTLSNMITGLVASGDLSGAQYKAVKLASTAGAVVVCNATSNIGIGILLNDPTSGQPASIAGPGSICKAWAGPADIAINELLGYDTTGRLADHTTDNRPHIAQALEASTAAGDFISVLVLGFGRY